VKTTQLFNISEQAGNWDEYKVL